MEVIGQQFLLCLGVNVAKKIVYLSIHEPALTRHTPSPYNSNFLFLIGVVESLISRGEFDGAIEMDSFSKQVGYFLYEILFM